MHFRFMMCPCRWIQALLEVVFLFASKNQLELEAFPLSSLSHTHGGCAALLRAEKERRLNELP